MHTHTVELLKQALHVAGQLGYEVRQDWLGGDGGGHCLVRGRKWLLLDLAQSPEEQLEVVVATLAAEVATSGVELPGELAERVHNRRAA